MMAYDTFQIDKICRTCLSEDQHMRSVFSMDDTSGETARLFEMLMSCSSVEVNQGDGLPEQICLNCVHYITKAFTFKQLCERSDTTLREFIAKSQYTKYIEELKPCLAQTIDSEPIAQLLLTNELYDVKDLENDANISYGIDEKQYEALDEKHCGGENGNDELGNVDSKLDLVDADAELNSVENKLELLVEMDLENDANISYGIDEKQYEALDEKHCRGENGNGELGNVDSKLDLVDADADAELNSVENKLELLVEMDLLNEKMDVIKDPKDDTDITIYPCEQCTACFVLLNDLKIHKRTKHKRIYGNRTCNVCNQEFASPSTLSRHVKVHEATRRHLCNECGKGFTRSDDLSRHLRTHTGEKPFECKLCGKCFAQSFRLLEHMRAHSNEKNFVCAKCGKAFARYTSLAAHNRTHLAIKTHQCSVCGKRLCGSSSLTIHMKTHTGQKDHICPFCNKGFSTPSNLIIHKRIHTGEKPYVCDHCEKGFPDPSRLRVHYRTHSGEKPYVCSVCSRGCVSSSQLKKHMRIHTGEKPYKCELCDKAYPRSEDLRVHIKTHTGNRNHVCEICKKGFYQSSTLKVHMRIHTGEKPYTCKVCNKTFSQTGSLSAHMKSHE